ncbi:MAG: hypothetical protein KR126chlam3_00927 [Chlamydiae bacterium]|nr:hypothetical protein [Chlamydiota bacterium]
MKKSTRYIPLLIIVILMLFAYFSGIYKALDFETLKYHHNELTEFVNRNPIQTPLMFISMYIAVAALSLPVAIFLSLLAGFLFPQPFCTIYVVIGATIGATILFLAAKTALGGFLKKKASPFLAKMADGFQKNAASYLLFLRFVPFFPFWVVNLAPAFFNIRLRTFIWTTLIGITPGTFVSTQAGRGLNAIFESEEGFTFGAIFNTEMKIALICLGILSLIPILVKKWRKKKDDRQ